ncbi:hypothetical protein [Allokutzneria albata]|uniref:N-formylglutamate amidohydrolase n=2 Tax=Allokutzneria albata TaxID=211114 RepID=A0A1G9XGA2_ALLAB|nr:hypothetical protein [Allokutzneria albata]SDM95750.1 hypothetical protein SAMN04489726_4193 [Allokutzneria albata]
MAAEGIVAARAGRLDEAVSLLARVDYELLKLRDPVHGDFHIVRETAAYKRCWGSYYLRLPPYRDVVVEVPHPRHDRYTPDFGVEALHRCQASLLLLAGTHRYANGRPRDGWEPPSDMARNPRSLFQAVHERLTTASTDVLQYHGFVEDHYPDVVLSNGSARPHAQLHRIAQRMRAAGVRTEVFDGSNWPSVGATKNPQARYTRRIGGRFYHMEHQPRVRDDVRLRSAMVEAVAAELG